jgi:hypothetical protein
MEARLVNRTIPLSQRPGDIVVLGFFVVNLLVITYMVDLEQLVITDPAHFTYPFWPPPFMVDAVHWWGRTFDPVLLARPAWWKATIWIDALFFGPFYVAAIYAFIKGRNWIRIPGIIYASVMLTNVTIILSEEAFGQYRTPELGIVLLANAAWVLFPLYLIYRLGKSSHPFTQTETSVAPVAQRDIGPVPGMSEKPS